MESTRLAGMEDLQRAAELVEMASEELAHQRGGELLLAGGGWSLEHKGPLPRHRLLDWLASRAQDPSCSLWIGSYCGVDVGVASARRFPTPSGQHCVTELLYVEPAARGVGVGEALMSEIAAWAGKLGLKGIDVHVVPGNRDTKSFLEGMGFKARLLVLHKDLRADNERSQQGGLRDFG